MPCGRASPRLRGAPRPPTWPPKPSRNAAWRRARGPSRPRLARRRPRREIRNTNLEIRNKFEIRNTASRGIGFFRVSDFEFVSDFVFRISSLSTMSTSKERAALPAFIQPMMAQFGQRFDSPDYLFEVNSDGVRCLAFIDHALPCRYRFVNRRRVDMTDRYPEFAFLGTLPDGTVLDGEMAVLRDGKSDFGLL